MEKEHLMRQALLRLNKLLLQADKNAVLALSFLLLTLFIYLDYQTHFEIAISFFYLIPIALVTWYIGPKMGRALAILSITAWLTFNLLSGRTYSQEFIRYINVVVRLALFLGIVELLWEFKQALLHEHNQSHTDHLTGIPNSREFYDRAEMEIERARRNRTPLSLAYIDIDNFKQFNDRLGHSEGDKLLRSVAAVVSRRIRKIDVFARIGGDEFVLLLPDTLQAGALSAMQKVEQAIAEEVRTSSLPIMLSVGVATFASPPSSVDAMLQKADQLMYQSKQLGRNRISSAKYD